MPILVKRDDVRSGTKAKARHYNVMECALLKGKLEQYK